MKNANILKIKDIADLQAGFAFRSALKHDPNGNLPVIQMRDFTDHNTLDYTHLTKTFVTDMKERFLASKGDIVTRTRGLHLKCAVVDKDEPSPIVSYPLFKISLKNKKVSPEYLAWAINHPRNQARLIACAQGQTVPMISKKDIEKLKIPIPDQETQARIVELDKLAREEDDLMKRLRQLRQLYMNGILMHGASGSLPKGG